ncbi:MAG: GNAT family N-acetyltransferase [Leptospiraceae bacterium]|nr:GNAT family N-acetyltransferase [Leptospiraceae bacterium]
MEPLKLGSVTLAESQEELAEIYRFRYEVYTEEMGYVFPWSDSQNKSLKDSVDDQSLNYYIRCESGEIIGVIRLFVFNDENVPESVLSKYRSNFFSEEFTGTNRMVISRFLIREDYRARSKAAWKLIQECYHQCDRNLVPLVFIDCSPHLVKFYEALGFRRYTDNFTDEVLGYKVPMVIILPDVEYLRKVGSPLYIFARKRRDARDVEEWYHATFPDIGDAILAQKVGTERLLSSIASHQASLPITFNQLSQKLKTSCVIKSRKNDIVIRQGEMGNEMYLVLSGAVEVIFYRSENNPQSLGILGPGDVFGELGFLVRSPRTSTIRALEDTELLMIAADKVEQLVDQYPKETAQLFLELIRLMARRFVDRYTTV